MDNEDPPQVLRVATPSGNSTYRIFFLQGPEVDSDAFRALWKPFAEQGCDFVRATRQLFAINVPPDADLEKVYDLLQQGEREGTWEFEEGYRARRE